MTVWPLCPGQGATAQVSKVQDCGGEAVNVYLAAINLSGEGCELVPGGGKGFDGGCLPPQEKSNPVLQKAL